MEILTETQDIKTTRRGSKRPGYNGTRSSALSAITNDLMAVLKTNIAKSADARRWRDLLLYYRERLGDRINEEGVRVRVLALVNLTLELERLTDGVVAGRGGRLLQKSHYDRQGHPRTLTYERGDPHLVIHIAGQIQTLLKSLGLDKDGNDNGKRNGKKDQEVNNNLG